MKTLKRLLVLCLMMGLALTGCSSEEEDKAATDLKKIEDDITTEVKDLESISQDDIQEAKTYIDEHIEDVENKVADADVQQKVAEYAEKLKEYAEVAEKDASLKENEIVTYGKAAYDRVAHALEHGEYAIEQDAEKAKEAFNTAKDKLKEFNSDVVNDFIKVFK